MLLNPMVHGLKAVHIYYLEYILILLSQALFYCQVLCLEMDTTYWLPKDYLGDQHHEITVLPRTVFLLLMQTFMAMPSFTFWDSMAMQMTI